MASEYNNYQLDVDYYELTERDKRILDNACLLVDNEWSLRELSKNCMLGKSQLSDDFKKLKYLSYELWLEVKKVYNKNVERFKGAMYGI